MGFFADLSTLQSKTLNKSKGRSVWSPRSQIDKNLYEKIAQKYIKEQSLDVLEGEAVSLNVKKTVFVGFFKRWFRNYLFGGGFDLWNILKRVNSHWI